MRIHFITKEKNTREKDKQKCHQNNKNQTENQQQKYKKDDSEQKQRKQRQGQKQNKKNQLWWFDKEDKCYFPAGVAFYEEKYGEYRLKIDVHPESQYYLRSLSSNENEVQYRLEVVLKKRGKFKGRQIVGWGHSNPLTQGDILINFGPYKKYLVLGGES